ncbi:hypothetical protein [Ruegeria arenilitoris]|uniref:hypothetical protein n=1 Tax=Ruegeria arenilitoris TaxID=1173585 RepID=UPI001480E61F|nr:hypothetical protein [Ruegeria arenilitoris]
MADWLWQRGHDMRIAGIDIGAKRDATVVAELDGRVLRRCKALPVPTDYNDVLEALRQAHSVNDLVVLDRTGVGDPLFDLLAPECPRLAAARIIRGGKIKVIGREINVGKMALMGITRRALSTGRVKAELPPHEAERLRDELKNFGAKAGRSVGQIKLEARRGHDDMVLAVGLALLGRGLWGSGQLVEVARCHGCGDAA